jgi:hypothetical protein
MKGIWIALGLTLIAGCRESETQLVAIPGTLKVNNQGSEAVTGRAEDWDGNDAQDFIVQPGKSVTVVVITDYRVKLHVWRSSDNALLFDDFWNVGELTSITTKVVTVYP